MTSQPASPPRTPHPLASPLLPPDPATPAVPPWREQLTLRGVAVAVVLGALLCVVIHCLNLSVGVIPELNVASVFLAFFLVAVWWATAGRLGFGRGPPFKRQENRRCSASYIFAMDRKTYELLGPDYPGNRAEDVKDPSLGWMISFLFLIALLGPFSIVVLRKVMVIDYKLAFPGGTATALMINSLHGKTEGDLAGKKVHCLVKYMSISFGWSFFKWFFSGVGDSSGFDNFPTFGIEAFKNTVQAGHWYPDNLGNSDFRGLYGYKDLDSNFFYLQDIHIGYAVMLDFLIRCVFLQVFIAISIILGDGLYNLVKIFVVVAKEFCNVRSKERNLPVQALEDDGSCEQLANERLQTEVFLKDGISPWFAVSGYIALAPISITTVPTIFPQLKWYLFLLCYILAPAIAFSNSYGMGLTNLNLAPTYGKVALFLFASLVGRDSGGIIAGLAGCGIIMSIACSTADLMQDFKSGYLTLSSPRSMFVAQLIGIALGCVIAPLTLWLFWTAFDIGDPDGEYKPPFAIMFREMAILRVEGFSALPLHCLETCYAAFFLALVISLLKDVTPANVSRFIPVPIAMATPCYVGAYFGMYMFIGTVILFA
ncbi:hypothetical protein BS78_06G070400 [Paspalum vaginatum]|nr:hypothetical protein BS78_06G070400 [Paspalum vaginatum]